MISFVWIGLQNNEMNQSFLNHFVYYSLVFVSFYLFRHIHSNYLSIIICPICCRYTIMKLCFHY